MYTSSCSLPATIMLICAADHGASAHAHACRPMALLARKTTNVALRDNNLPSSFLGGARNYVAPIHYFICFFHSCSPRRTSHTVITNLTPTCTIEHYMQHATSNIQGLEKMVNRRLIAHPYS